MPPASWMPGAQDHVNENVRRAVYIVADPWGLLPESPVSPVTALSPGLAGGSWGTGLTLAGGLAMRGASVFISFLPGCPGDKGESFS